MIPDLAKLNGKRIGFIGCGSMARALASGLASAGFDAGAICGSDPAPEPRAHFERDLGIATAPSNAELAARSDVVVLAVKPGVVLGALQELGRDPDLARPLWISIAAGVRLARLEAALPPGARVIRAMPNTPALVGAGATAYCAGAAAGPSDLEAAGALFAAIGLAWRSPDEALLDAVTGLSGSGPAYVFLILEALEDAGESAGLPRDAARQLAVQTVYGAARLALETGEDPVALRNQVATPGGTTEAGLERLEAGGLRTVLRETVAAATARSRELSGG